MLIWSLEDKSSVLSGIGQVLAHNQDIPVNVTDDFAGIPPGVTGILCLGNDPKEAMSKCGVVPKNRTIGSLRGRVWHMPSGLPVMFSYNPSIVEIDYGKFVDTMTDVAGMFRVLRTGKLAPQLGDYKYVLDFKETIEVIKAKSELQGGRPVDVALDLETVGKDEFKLPDPANNHPGAYIVSIQVTHTTGSADVVYFKNRQAMLDWMADPDNHAQVEWLLNSPQVSLRGANLKYDLRWLAQHGKFECTNFKFDTSLVGALLDENRPNGLDVHAKIYVPRLAGYSDEFDRTVDKARMDLVPPEKLLPYAGGDTDACLEVSYRQREELLKDKDLSAFYVNILHPAARAMEMVERGGVCVDLDAFNQLEADLNTEALQLVTKARKLMGGRMYYKHMDEKFAGGINLTKASLLKDYFFSPMGLNLKPEMLTEKTQEPSTSLEHLMMFENIPEAAEFVKVYSEFASLTKTLSTYVVGFREHLRSDGRFHPSYWLFPGKKDDGDGGTVTGRLSCKDPAYQTLPKHTKWAKRIRRCYIAPPGFQVLECVAPETGILTANLEYVRADSLKPGDELLAFDEESPGGKGTHRRFRTGIVESSEIGMASRQRLTFDDGSSQVVSHGHQFLCLYGKEKGWLNWRKVGAGGKCIGVGTRIAAPAPVEFADYSWEAGYLSAMFDGEGWVYGANRRGWAMGVAQKEGTTLEKIKRTLLSFTPTFGMSTNGAGVKCLTVCDTYDILSLQMRVRPERLIAKRAYENKALSRGKMKTVVRVEELGLGPVVCLKTSTKTYISDGLASHNCDYSQGELKVIACIANEPNMLAAYQNNMDLHAITSGRFAGYTYDQMMAMKAKGEGHPEFDIYEAIRQLGKAGNFGLIYGMSAEGFLDYAISNYGVRDLTLKSATDFRNGFFEQYPVLIHYHDTYKRYARKHGYVRSPLGRIRHLPLINSNNREMRAKAERQAINSPVQATLTDMMIWALSLSVKQGWHLEAPTFGLCHDAKNTYVPEDNAEFHVKREIELMENLPFDKVGWKPQLKFTADAKIGPNLADLHKVKLTA